MKQIITIVTLIFTIVLFNASLAAEEKDKTPTPPITPVPEVIKCEDSGSCEMTEIDKLPSPKEEKKLDKK